MKFGFKKLGMALGLGAIGAFSLATATPAAAKGAGGDDAAIAIGAGILGLAVGAAIADRDDNRYYDRRYYSSRRYVTVRDRPGYYYYYDGYPNRYYRDRYYTRYYAPYYRERVSRRHDRYDRRYERRYDRHDRRYDRRYDRRKARWDDRYDRRRRR